MMQMYRNIVRGQGERMGVTGMPDEKICPFMSKPGTQMHTIGLVDSVYCQKDRCMAWEPHPKVDEYDTFEGGICRLIP